MDYHVVTKTKAMYGWSKYGGPNMGLVKQENDTWYCQSCGEEYPEEMSPFMMPMDDTMREFIRICGICYKRVLIKRIKYIMSLFKSIRKGSGGKHDYQEYL